MVFFLRRPYPFKVFKGCLPQILLGPFLNSWLNLFFINPFLANIPILYPLKTPGNVIQWTKKPKEPQFLIFRKIVSSAERILFFDTFLIWDSDTRLGLYQRPMVESFFGENI